MFLKQAEKHGPVSTVLWGGKITTCIVGHERALRFIDEAADKQRAASPDRRSQFPVGFLRAMEGEHHRKYRHILLGAFKATPLAPHDIAVRKIIRNTLGVLAGASEPPSLLNHLVRNDLLDDTMLGNLIQMIAVARSDVRGLWVWIIKMLSSSPDILAQLRDGPEGDGGRGFAKAVVEETLRMEQIEFLHKVATSDIVFDGYFIAKGSHVRLCLWEGHKDLEKFPDPFKFDPARFTRTRHMIDSFAPSGWGNTAVPAATGPLISARRLSKNWRGATRLDLVADGPAVLGGFHFEPSPNFAVTLHRHRERQQAAVH